MLSSRSCVTEITVVAAVGKSADKRRPIIARLHEMSANVATLLCTTADHRFSSPDLRLSFLFSANVNHTDNAQHFTTQRAVIILPLEPNSNTRTPATNTGYGHHQRTSSQQYSTTNLPHCNARAQHLDMSRCWDVANFCPLVVFVGGVRSRCPCSGVWLLHQMTVTFLCYKI